MNSASSGCAARRPARAVNSSVLTVAWRRWPSIRAAPRRRCRRRGPYGARAASVRPAGRPGRRTSAACPGPRPAGPAADRPAWPWCGPRRRRGHCRRLPTTATRCTWRSPRSARCGAAATVSAARCGVGGDMRGTFVSRRGTERRRPCAHEEDDLERLRGLADGSSLRPSQGRCPGRRPRCSRRIARRPPSAGHPSPSRTLGVRHHRAGPERGPAGSVGTPRGCPVPQPGELPSSQVTWHAFAIKAPTGNHRPVDPASKFEHKLHTTLLQAGPDVLD